MNVEPMTHTTVSTATKIQTWPYFFDTSNTYFVCLSSSPWRNFANESLLTVFCGYKSCLLLKKN